MIDHFTLTVRDLQRSRAFYERALAPLGYKVRMSFEQYVGFGDSRKPYFWIKQGDVASSPMHIAFKAEDRRSVDAFHSAALAAGAQDDGAPGLRTHYHPDYYGSFVIDLDGHPIEAVCHAAVAVPAAAKAVRKKASPRAKAKKRAKKTGHRK